MKDLAIVIMMLKREKEKLLEEKEKNEQKIKECEEKIACYQELYKEQLFIVCVNNKNIESCHTVLSNNSQITVDMLLDIKTKICDYNRKVDNAVLAGKKIQEEIGYNEHVKEDLHNRNIVIQLRLLDIEGRLEKDNNKRLYKRG